MHASMMSMVNPATCATGIPLTASPGRKAWGTAAKAPAAPIRAACESCAPLGRPVVPEV